MNAASKAGPSWFGLVLCEPLTIPLLGAGEAATDVEAGEVVSPIVEGFVAYAGRYSFHGDRSCITSSYRCSPTGSRATRSGRSSLPGTG